MYGRRFFSDRSGSRHSAAAVVPYLVELIAPTSVVDFGCGTGEWLEAFREAGIADVVGVDGDYVPADRLRIPQASFVGHDLSTPIDLGRTFDLAISLEVGEHLPIEAAPVLVESLLRAAPVVLFGAAIPDQRGEGHVNEQWQEWWAKLFADGGLRPVDILRHRFWSDDRVEWWYVQNALLYATEDAVAANEALRSASHRTSGSPLSVVHPRGYMSFRAPRRVRDRIANRLSRRRTS